MWRYFTRNKTRRYVDILPDIVYNYNHSFHRSIQRTPAEVNSTNVLPVWKTLYGSKMTPKAKKPTFKVGDLVRISKAKKTFEKGYIPNWTRELISVSKVISDRYPYVYKIEDYNKGELEGTFYEKELQKVVLAYKKRRVGKKTHSPRESPVERLSPQL